MGNAGVVHPAAANAQVGGAGAIIAGIALGGLLAGVVDIFAASAINQANPGVILQAIASGVLGKISFLGGARTMVLGLILQLAMSLVIAAIYGGASLRLSSLVQRPVLCGALYGVGVFLVMNFIVVPLSAAPMAKHLPSPAHLVMDLAAMILFGLIVALSPKLLARAR
jgi:hypothetical protein